MEFRWLTSDERRTQTVESSSLSDVLALAQNLQSEGEGLVSEEQAIEMGRELGVRAEYVHEALRLRRRAAQPAGTLPVEPADHHPLSAAGRALLGVFALLMLPATARSLTDSGRDPVWIIVALIAAVVAGWSARYPRLAGITGAAAVPMILVVSSFYRYPYHPHGTRGESILFALLSLGPLCSAAGRTAAGVRRWAERFADRPRQTASTQ